MQPPALEPFLREVEKFALGEYSSALLAGSLLPEKSERAIAEKLHSFTGLPVDYILKANLRVSGGAFSKTLQDAEGLTTGRIDTRYRGPDLNRLSEEAEYDPQASAISSAYTTAINSYLRTELKFGQEETYQPSAYAEIANQWDFRHKAPGEDAPGVMNTMPDLATAMKANPKMHVLLTGGYYDLATPYYEGVYEMHHLPIPKSMQMLLSSSAKPKPASSL